MTKIIRPDADIAAFASSSKSSERTVFGGTTMSDLLADNLNASFARGWGIVGANELPSIQDFNAAMYTISQLTAYLHQMGIGEYNGNQTYYAGSIVNSAGVLYRSLKDDNKGNDLANTTYWKKIDYLDKTDGGTVSGNTAFTGTLNAKTLYASGNITSAAAITALNMYVTGILETKDLLAKGNITSTNGVMTASGFYTKGIIDAKYGKIDGSNIITEATALGWGQTWRNVTGSRSANVTYTNSAGKPIFVSVVWAQADTGNMNLIVDGLTIGKGQQQGTEGAGQVSGIIPNGSTYMINTTNRIDTWFELR